MAEFHGAVQDLGDLLDEADLGDALLSRDVVGLAERLRVSEHRHQRVGQVVHVAELAEPATVAGHQHRPPAEDAVEEERLVVPRVERAEDVGRPHDGDGEPAGPLALEQRVLARDLVAGVVAPVVSSGRRLAERDREGVVVDPAGRDEEHVRSAGQGVGQGRHIFARGRRIGGVADAVEAGAGERGLEGGVVFPVAGDHAHARGQPIVLAAAVEHGDGVAVADQRADESEADELRSPDDEDAHDGRHHTTTPAP